MYYYPTVLCRVQIAPQNEYKYHVIFVLQRTDRLDRLSWHTQVTNWIEVTPKKGVLDNKYLIRPLFCSIAENFYLLFVFGLAVRARQNIAELVKILSDTTRQNV